MSIFVGCAGWTLRSDTAAEFSPLGTHLERYASRFRCVEINSSFYRPHQRKTYQRWAASTPDDFRFSVKAPKTITHEQRLVDVEGLIEDFLAGVTGLGAKLGPILIQLPPSLAFETDHALLAFAQFRTRVQSPIVCEPRHRSWFEPAADALLQQYKIGRVAADPGLVPAAADPAGCQKTCYFRWHGSPRVYYSGYADETLRELATRLQSLTAVAQDVWCIFDNTAAGEAIRNALTVQSLTQSDLPVSRE
jgi:uncharacterized protein YecE (DUF72 family)